MPRAKASVLLVETATWENNMHYKKYVVRSPLFALRDPRLSEQVLAAFSGAARRPAAPPPQRARAVRRYEVPRC